MAEVEKSNILLKDIALKSDIAEQKPYDDTALKERVSLVESGVLANATSIDDKLDKVAKAADSAKLNGKADTEFATAEQGARADGAATKGELDAVKSTADSALQKGLFDEYQEQMSQILENIEQDLHYNLTNAKEYTDTEIDTVNRRIDTEVFSLNDKIDNLPTGGGGGVADSVDWDDVKDKPTEFKPTAHTHNISEVGDLEVKLENLQIENTELKSGKLDKTAKAADSAKLNGKTDEDFATAVQGQVAVDAGFFQIAFQYPVSGVTSIFELIQSGRDNLKERYSSNQFALSLTRLMLTNAVGNSILDLPAPPNENELLIEIFTKSALGSVDGSSRILTFIIINYSSGKQFSRLCYNNLSANILYAQWIGDWVETITTKNIAEYMPDLTGLATKLDIEKLDGALQEEISRAIEAETANNINHDLIKMLIDPQAAINNKLISEQRARSIFANGYGTRVTYTAAGDPFPTHADLVNAQIVYSHGAEYTPTLNDVCTVLADENHPVRLLGQQTEYVYDGQEWIFSAILGLQPFTTEQEEALNSGINAGHVSKLNNIENSVTANSQNLVTSGAVNTKFVSEVGGLNNTIEYKASEVYESAKAYADIVNDNLQRQIDSIKSTPPVASKSFNHFLKIFYKMQDGTKEITGQMGFEIVSGQEHIYNKDTIGFIANAGDIPVSGFETILDSMVESNNDRQGIFFIRTNYNGGTSLKILKHDETFTIVPFDKIDVTDTVIGIA